MPSESTYSKSKEGYGSGRFGKFGKTGGPRRKGPRRMFGPRRTPIKFKISKDTKIDYKDFNTLRKYISDRGKILSRRVTGVSAKDQRLIAREIKKARYLGLMMAIPFSR